jgi:hypothetical protein
MFINRWELQVKLYTFFEQDVKQDSLDVGNLIPPYLKNYKASFKYTLDFVTPT